MEDLYYSKKLDQHFQTRLDFLLYAHDGRGFGHASRTIAVGMALKRLYPERRTLFISGIPDANMLIGPAPLDWIKLPSYQTVIKDGIPEGQTGKAGFYKSVLGGLRAEMLKATVEILRPRCVLVDHNPAGKRNELTLALEHSLKPDSHDTAWVLGLRGIIGEDRRLWSPATADLVQRYYREVLWYGDETLLGAETRQRISSHFSCEPISVGYVSRLQELRSSIQDSVPKVRRPACTISLPWLGEYSDLLLQSLAAAARQIGAKHGPWHLYVPAAHLEPIQAEFADLSFCRIEPVGENYLSSLVHARSALIYGGYNSILDVAAAQVPALIILRSTKDREQHEHLERLQQRFGKQWQVLEEQDISGPHLARALQGVIDNDAPLSGAIDISGAEQAARILHSCIDDRD